MAFVCPHCYTVNEDSGGACKSCKKVLERDAAAPFDFNTILNPGGSVTADGIKTSLGEEIQKIKAGLDRSLAELLRGSGLDLPGFSKSSVSGGSFLSQGAPLAVSRSGTDLYNQIDLAEMDKVFARDFRLENYRWFSQDKLLLPTVFCSTPEEFTAAMFERQNISETMRRQLVEAASADMQAEADKGGTYGFFINGQGCYVNGWLVAKSCGLQLGDAKTMLANPAVKARVVRVAAHEKLGHGFLAEFTKQGVEMRALHMGLHRLAREFNIKLADSPDYTLLDEKWRTIFGVSRYAEEGWASWIEDYVSPRMQLEKVGGAIEPEHILRLFDKIIASPDTAAEGKDFLEKAGNAICAICSGASNVEAADIPHKMQFLQRCDSALGDLFAQTFGQEPCYIVGQLMIQTLERKFGVEALPLLLAIAGCITYSIERHSCSDLALAVAKDPKLSMDVRLALLTKANAKKGDLKGIAKSAKEDLGLSIPESVLF